MFTFFDVLAFILMLPVGITVGWFVRDFFTYWRERASLHGRCGYCRQVLSANSAAAGAHLVACSRAYNEAVKVLGYIGSGEHDR